MSNSRETIKLVIIDSGFSSHSALMTSPSKLLSLKVREGKCDVTEGACDLLGHGTAVFSLIVKEMEKYADSVDFTMIKIFDQSMNVEEVTLIEALRYCVDVLAPDIIHMSNGITCCENLTELKQICRHAEEKGIIIVAAYDNFGAITYPAAFENVIGVDVSDELKVGYIYSERDDVNVIVPNVSRRVPWLHNEYFNCNGTSFNACTVTSTVIKLMAVGKRTLREIRTGLKLGATSIMNAPFSPNIKRCPKIKRAIVFPFNKEIHSIVRFSHLLNFELYGLYDVKYNRNIGKFAQQLLGIESEKGMPICSFENIDWEDEFDTVILGHVSQIESRTKIHYTKLIIEKCLDYSKQLVSLGALTVSEELLKMYKKKGLKYFIPEVTENDVSQLYGGKLRKIGIPVLGVFGTSSKQGKFTLQLALRERFLENGYTVGQLGTEPTSFLFGIDETYPMGYESTVTVSGTDAIIVLNEMMGRLEDKNPDIIIVGGQSQTIPQQTGNTKLYVLQQHEFVLATNPDAVLLCVNMFDEDVYIKRTIGYIESVVDADVIALVLFPMQREMQAGIITNKLITATPEKVRERAGTLMSYHGRKVFIAGDEDDMIFEQCIEYFSNSG